MKILTIFILVQIIFTPSFSQEKRAYQTFSSGGKKVDYCKMFKAISQADIIFFGELHNNPISHWLQFEISYDLLRKGDLTFGGEMFEADNQDELNLYLADSINFKSLDSLARLWHNYKTDYAPLVELAKAFEQPFIATNIPRKYANLVYKKGFEALDTITIKEKTWMAPLPIDYDPEIPSYKRMITMMEGHGGENLPKAQAIKDATMAYFISQNIVQNKKFIHFNGTYHSNYYEGIIWYLKKLKPGLKYVTIATVSQSQINKLEEENKLKADFIICVDDDMTTTY